MHNLYFIGMVVERKATNSNAKANRQLAGQIVETKIARVIGKPNLNLLGTHLKELIISVLKESEK